MHLVNFFAPQKRFASILCISALLNLLCSHSRGFTPHFIVDSSAYLRCPHSSCALIRAGISMSPRFWQSLFISRSQWALSDGFGSFIVHTNDLFKLLVRLLHVSERNFRYTRNPLAIYRSFTRNYKVLTLAGGTLSGVAQDYTKPSRLLL